MSKPKDTTDGNPPADGHWDKGAPQPVNPATGQHGAYWVLPASERAKGFVRPYRTSYTHVGPAQPERLRDLTDEEKERYKEAGYVKFEQYPRERSEETGITGRFWTQAQLNKKGCGGVTTMGKKLAETYARDPSYYGATFCAPCAGHFPVGEFIWDGTEERVGS